MKSLKDCLSIPNKINEGLNTFNIEVIAKPRIYNITIEKYEMTISYYDSVEDNWDSFDLDYKYDNNRDEIKQKIKNIDEPMISHLELYIDISNDEDDNGEISIDMNIDPEDPEDYRFNSRHTYCNVENGTLLKNEHIADIISKSLCKFDLGSFDMGVFFKDYKDEIMDEMEF